MNFKYLFGAFCIMLCLIPMAFAESDLMVMHGKAYDGNYLMASGDVRVQIYTAQSGGALLYDSLTDFNGAINNGLFDILLGSGVSLDLNLGQRYYYAMQINAKDINFGTSLRQVFQSAHGDLNAYNISDLNNNVGYITAAALNPYLTKVDANGFYAFKTDVNLWTNQLLVPYLTKSDANGFYALKADVNIWTQQLLVPYTLKSDTNVWIVQKLAPYLLQVDANGFFAFKTDVNLWTNQLLVPYLLKTDANGFYALKNDVNVWTNQLLVPYLTKIDANGFYPIKTDVNVWIDQKLVPYLLGTDANGFYVLKSDVNNWIGQLDTNWQTSWSVFDANIKNTYSTYFVTQTDGNLWYVKQTDGNAWYVKQIDGNAWYQLKADFNADLNNGISLQSCPPGFALNSLGTNFTCVGASGSDTNWQTSWAVFDVNMKATYTQISDANALVNQLIFLAQQDSNQWTLTKLDGNALYALKSDVNIWTTQLMIVAQQDSNQWTLTKLDGNALYALKSDINIWIGQLDTNWQTSWTAFDANMKTLFVPYIGATADVNLGYNDLLVYWIKDLLNRNSISINTRLMYDPDGNYALSWNTRSLSDEDENPSIQWGNRYLINSNGDIAAIWDTNFELYTSLVGNGHNITGINNLSATNLAGNLNWVYLQNYPTGCGAGQAIQALGDTLICVDTNAYSVITIDTNWVTSWAIFDANMKATYMLLGSDTNWQTSWGILDANLKSTYYTKSDVNASFLSKIDANGFYALKTDINKTPLNTPFITGRFFTDYNSITGVFGQTQIYYTDLNIVPITCPAGTYMYGLLTGGIYCSTPLDTNWQTSFGTFDANMKATYTQLTDTNIWIDQKIAAVPGLVDTNWVTSWDIFDVNMKYYFALKSDVNIWASQLDVLREIDYNQWYLLKTDANGFYTLKTDTNVWASQLIFVAQSDSNQWTLTKLDANGFYAIKTDVNVWTNQLLLPYLTKVDANGFYTLKSDTNTWATQLIFVAQSDSNNWVLTKLDANALFALKTDVNAWTNQLLTPYLTKSDANGFYTLKTDTNIWANQLIIAAQIDSNNWVLTKVDANALYALKSDINVWTNQLLVPYLTKADANEFYTLKTDSNVWTNQLILSSQVDMNNWVLTKVDANALYILKSDANTWTNQLLVPYLSKVDANGFYPLKTDINNWTNQLLVPYLLKTDANEFYAYKTDVNNWANQLILTAQLDSNKWTLTKLDANGFYAYKTDVNLWGGQLYVPYIGATQDINILSRAIIDVNYIDFDINGGPVLYHEGAIYYDDIWNALIVEQGRDVTLQIGQEELTRIYNNTGSTLADGKAVFVTGVWTGGDNNVPTVALANASTDANAQVFGITTQSIPNNDYGFITIRGYINDLNTEDASWNIGDTLYLSDTVSGDLTNIVPSNSTSLQVKIGTLITKGITTGRINVRLVPVLKLGNLADVTISNPSLSQVLTFNGVNWVNGTASTVSGSNGIAFYPDTNDINKNTNQNFFGLESLYKVPITTTPQTAETLIATAGLSPVEPYIYDTDLNRSIIDAGTWTFNMYLGANRIDRNPYLFNVIYKIRQYAPTDINVTTTGAGATRYVIASSGAPFSTALIDTNFTANDQNLYAGYLQTPMGAYKVIGRTSDTNITISTPTTYVNENNVKFFTWKRLFMVRSQIINNVLPTYTLYSISSSQGAFDMNYTDRIAMMIVAVASNTTSITYVYNGSTYYSYFNTPLITLHNNLAGLQGGSADEFYHLTQAQFIIATQSATSTRSGYLTSVDWATFNSKANMTDLNAYTLRQDTNVWANQLILSAQLDMNKWALTKLDGNVLYALKNDVNIWANQLLVPYLLKSDANIWSNQLIISAQIDSNKWSLTKVDGNALYTLKADTNTWASQLDMLVQLDSNKWSLTKLDANGFYVLKSDANVWTSQLIVASQTDMNAWVLTKVDANALYALKGDVNTWIGQLDTNWETSWGVLDANLKATYTQLADTNIWIDQKIAPYLLQIDANGFYTLKSDTNIWASQLDVAMQADANKWNLTKLDANGFYALKNDVNTWIDQKIIGLSADTNWQTSFGTFDANMRATYALRADVNTWANQLIVSAQIDSNKWGLNKLDANSLYALKWDVNIWIGQLDTNWQTSWGTLDANLRSTYTLKTDTNIWIDQKLVPYLSKADANGFYPLKADVNVWAGQKDIAMQVDSNKWSLTKVDANGFYVLKTDANTWTTQLILTQQADSNKWTLTKLDANGFYTLKPDTNTWGNQLILTSQADSNKWSLTKLDANGFYSLKSDVNVWIAQNLVPYLSKADANGFYALKSDVNTWGDQRYLKLTGGNITGSVVATQDINAKILKADTNIYIGTNVYMYDDGTALVIGRT